MLENKSGLYAAFVAKDTRFDGRFFVGISSTGIYCRPVCRAKQPKAENCTFYDIVNIGLHFFLKNVRPYAASCNES